MEYVQERVPTLHDLDGATPDAPLPETAVVVPMSAREEGRPAAERTLETLAEVDPPRVVVPVRAPPECIGSFRSWLAGFPAVSDVLWCNSPAVEDLLARHGVAGATPDGPGAAAAGRGGTATSSHPCARGKGADVWLGLGIAAADAEYVVVHDADATSYDASYVPRLAAPLADGFAFAKGYYARVEEDGLYGRLFRLFYAPLVEALAGGAGSSGSDADAPARADSVLDYLGAFRYALAGEFGMTADLARSLRAQRAWGLEVGTLGEAFRHAGRAGSAQVDLGVHRHAHRAVDGDGGLATMSEQVGDALFRVLADHGVEPDYEALRERYRTIADRLIGGYAADARHNGLPYDAAAEREQVAAYADAIGPPGRDTRLPAWRDLDLDPADVLAASEESLATAASDSSPG